MTLSVEVVMARRVASRRAITYAPIRTCIKLRPADGLAIVVLSGVAAAIVMMLRLSRMRERAWLKHNSALLIDLFGTVTQRTMIVAHILIALLLLVMVGSGALRIQRLQRLRLERMRLELLHSLLTRLQLLSHMTELRSQLMHLVNEFFALRLIVQRALHMWTGIGHARSRTGCLCQAPLLR